MKGRDESRNVISLEVSNTGMQDLVSLILLQSYYLGQFPPPSFQVFRFTDMVKR